MFSGNVAYLPIWKHKIEIKMAVNNRWLFLLEDFMTDLASTLTKRSSQSSSDVDAAL